MANKARLDGAWFKNAAGVYVQGEPTDATLMASATTGDVLTVKSDDTVHPRTITGAGGIAITVNADDIEVDGSAIAAGGSVVLYDSGALGGTAASIDTGASGIGGGYDVLEIWALLRTDQAVAASTIDVRVNNDSSAVYSYQRVSGVNATASANVVAGATSWQISAVGASMASGVFHVIRMTIPFYTETVAHKAAEILHGRHDTTAANGSIEARALRWASTAAITRMAFIAPSTFNFIAGSHVIIYGR
jgi:hypothetical protein